MSTTAEGWCTDEFRTHVTEHASMPAPTSVGDEEREARSAVMRYVTRLIDYGKTGVDESFDELTIGQITDQIIAAGSLRAETGETTVEWGTTDHATVDEQARVVPAEHFAREYAAFGHRVFRRERTTYPDRVTDWLEVPADE